MPNIKPNAELNTKTMSKENTSQETVNSVLRKTDVSCSFYQDETTRKPNGLLYKMRQLFDDHKLTTWEYLEFRRMVRSFCEEYDLYFNEKDEMVYKRDKQNYS